MADPVIEDQRAAEGEADTTVAADGTLAAPPERGFRNRLFHRERWLAYCLPFIVYMIVGSLEPKGSDQPGILPKPTAFAAAIDLIYGDYPLIYTFKIVAVCAAIVFCAPGVRELGFKKPGWLAIVVGAVGVVVWIVLAEVQRAALANDQSMLGQWFKVAHSRTGFNPLRQLRHNPAWEYTFLLIRFFGLVVVVPIMEEFFLRGFFMRFVVDSERDWREIPFATATPLALAMGTVLPMMMHPGEVLAAAVWFSMITWLQIRTNNIWDCVLAHGVTNLLLGLFVVATGRWYYM